MKTSIEPVVPHGFHEIGIEGPLVDAIGRLGIDAPTEVQKLMIPAVLAGRDCLTRVRSGSGKTNAFLLPILQQTIPGAGLQALIVMPTRGAAQQLQKYFFRFIDEGSLNIAIVARGGLRPPRDVAQGRTEIVIATPRGASEVGRMGVPDTLRTIVVDDIDTTFDLDGTDALDPLFDDLQRPVQKLLLAAVISDDVRNFAQARLSNPHAVEVTEAQPPIQRIAQQQTRVEDDQAIETLITIMKQQRPRLALIFANSEQTGRDVAATLNRVRVPARWSDDPRRAPEGDESHGGGRGRFAPRGGRPGGPGESEAIVTADPARRRLATLPASMLIHYELPDDPAVYAARLSNCDRLSRRGVSLALVRPSAVDTLVSIEALVGKPLEAVGPFERPPQDERGPRRESRERGRRDEQVRPSDREAGRPMSSPPRSVPAREVAAPQAAPTTDPPIPGRKPLPKTLGSRFPTRPRR